MHFFHLLLLLLTILSYCTTKIVAQDTYEDSKESPNRVIAYPKDFVPVLFNLEEMTEYKQSHTFQMGLKYVLNLDKLSAISSSVYLGSIPRSDKQVKAMKAEGITNAVNLLLPYEYSGLDQLYEANNINELRLYVKDHTEPPVSYVRAGVEYLIRKEIAGEKTYVHCKGGHGRSAAIVFAYAMVVQPDKTLEELQTLFDTMKRTRSHKVRGYLNLQKNILDFKNYELEGLRQLRTELIAIKNNYRDQTQAQGAATLQDVRDRHQEDLKEMETQMDKDALKAAFIGKIAATERIVQDEAKEK